MATYHVYIEWYFQDGLTRLRLVRGLHRLWKTSADQCACTSSGSHEQSAISTTSLARRAVGLPVHPRGATWPWGMTSAARRQSVIACAMGMRAPGGGWRCKSWSFETDLDIIRDVLATFKCPGTGPQHRHVRSIRLRSNYDDEFVGKTSDTEAYPALLGAILAAALAAKIPS